MVKQASAAIAVMIALGASSSARADLTVVTAKGNVIVPPAGEGVQLGTGREVDRPAPIADGSASGARVPSRRALPEPGVVIEQAESMVLAGPEARATNAHLAAEYGPLLSAAAEVFDLDEGLLRAVVWQESRYHPGIVSPKGAIGLMQLMPDTARELGVLNPYDPIQNVAGGARYLRTLLRRYSGNVSLALAAYNAGAGAVQRYGGIPPFRETQAYVAAIRARLVSN